jgi:hypothetical protein
MNNSLTKNSSSMSSGKFHQENAFTNNNLFIPLGEKLCIRMKLQNRFPIELSVSNMTVDMTPANKFNPVSQDFVIPPTSTKVVDLSVIPTCCGTFKVDSACWNISEFLAIRHELANQGPRLFKTLSQRASATRGPDSSLNFEVVAAHPLLKLSIENCKLYIPKGIHNNFSLLSDTSKVQVLAQT